MKPYYQDESCTIYHGDCRDVLPRLEKVALVLTDPPYGIGHKWAKSQMVGKNGSSRLWGQGDKWDDATITPSLIRKVVAHGDNAIIWGGNYYALPPSRGWLVWDKVQRFSGADAELAWTSFDASVRVHRLSRIDAYVNQAESIKVHPTEKPLALMRWCIHEGLDPLPGEVLDPFMGSGTTLRAAKDLGRKAIGIEIEERYCEIAAQRLGQEVLDLGMAA